MDEMMDKRKRRMIQEDNITLITEGINECNRLLSKDFEKEEYRGSGNMKGINPWITFVKAYSQKNNLKPKDAMKEIKRL